MAGHFLLKFFSARDAVDVKGNGEANVRCPFPHGKDRHLEKHPSAHINPEKALFHCKTCAAEGRFSDGGLSEANFLAKINNISYEEAIRILKKLSETTNAGVNLETATDNLLHKDDYKPFLDYLNKDRGITKETIQEYQLGHNGDGIIYPIIVYGELLDVRTYNKDWKTDGTPKIKSQNGASALLFPFDHWYAQKDTNPTILCAGENDTLLLRQFNYNAITTTMGEGSFPKMFKSLFKGLEVWICYDCDDAGVTGAKKLAFQLTEVGAIPRIINLGLTGEKDDKDITDFFQTRKLTKEDFEARKAEAVTYTHEDLKELKDIIYPLIDLWEVVRGEHTGQRRSSRVLNMGKIGIPMEVPTAVEWSYVDKDENGKITNRHEGWWTLDETNLDEVLELVECKKTVLNKNLQRFIGIAPDIHVNLIVRARQPVQKVVFAPDVETENELSGYQQAEHIAYVIGAEKLEDGGRYRAYYKKYPHPIQGQEITLVVDRIEDSDNSLNTFRMSPEMVKELDEMFGGDPTEVMKRRYENVQRIVGKFAPEMVCYAVDLTYHSVLDFQYGDRLVKGHPEGLVVGDTRTGKSDISKSMQAYYGVGNYTDLKMGSLAGLLGGAEPMSNGAWRLKWGVIPQNHRGMLILDELSGLKEGVFNQLTALRSEREAILTKIVRGKAPAKTRMIWLSNPRGARGSNANIEDYPNGMTVAGELIGKLEDLARFDFVVLTPRVDNSRLISPLTKEKLDETHNPAYRHLIYWVWTRTAEQVKFADRVKEYIWDVSLELNEQYETSVNLLGPEAYKKLARLAISVAGCCFSHDGDGDSILVRKEHVDWARDFLIRCYDNDDFRLPEFVLQEKTNRETNPEINALVAQLCQQHHMIMEELHRKINVSANMLRMLSGYEPKDFNKVINLMAQKSLIVTGKGDEIKATLRLKKAFKSYLKDHSNYRMETIQERKDAAL